VIQKMELFSARPSAPVLPLSGATANTDPIQVRNVDGMGPVKAEITTTKLGSGGRGVIKQGENVDARNLVITVGLNPDWEENTMASLRHQLYAYLMPPEWVKVRFYSDELPPVDIEGYVESMDPNIFSSDPELQISIICPDPDFIDTSATLIYGLVDDEDEIEFTYIGTVDTGFELRVQQTGANPTFTGSLDVEVQNSKTETFSIDPVTINGVKSFKLSTINGAKRAMNIDVADGLITNLLAAVTDGSVWPRVRPGQNVIKVSGTEEGQSWTLGYFNRFGGL
jgi:hypothetical protein